MAKIIATIVGGIVAFLGLAILFGAFIALIWNHFPFLEGLHHMSWWDGVLINILCGFLFRPSTVQPVTKS